MAVDLTNVNIDDVAGKVVVPQDTYLLLICKAEEKKSKSGSDMIMAQFEIVEGDYEGVKLTHYFTWASEWGKKFCKMYAQAADINPADFSADSLISFASPVKAVVEVEEGKPYINKDGDEVMGSDQNKINPFSWAKAL